MANRIKRDAAILKLKQDKLNALSINPKPAKTTAVIKAEASHTKIELMEDGTPVAIVPMDRLKAIRQLGIDVDTMGALPMANGFCVLSEVTLAKMFERVNGVIDDVHDPATVINGARAIAYVANTMCKLIGESRQLNQMKKPIQGPRNKSFTPGQAVAVQVNIQNKIEKDDGKVA